MSYSPSCMEEEDLGAWLGLGIGGGGGGGGGCSPSRSHGERWSSVRFDKQDEMRGCGYEQAENKKSDDKGRTRKRCPSPSEEEDDGGDGGARKKLQLSKEQATLLEDTFRSHNILSYAQKHELARLVNLTPRQVEVWFQNRRARTKLKQTEVDCEILKRCCASLTVENQRLKHELVGLQRSGAVAGLYVVDNQFPRAAPADTVSVCPSCEKVTLTSVGDTSNKSSSYSS